MDDEQGNGGEAAAPGAAAVAGDQNVNQYAAHDGGDDGDDDDMKQVLLSARTSAASAARRAKRAEKAAKRVLGFMFLLLIALLLLGPMQWIARKVLPWDVLPMLAIQPLITVMDPGITVPTGDVNSISPSGSAARMADPTLVYSASGAQPKSTIGAVNAAMEAIQPSLSAFTKHTRSIMDLHWTFEHSWSVWSSTEVTDWILGFLDGADSHIADLIVKFQEQHHMDGRAIFVLACFDDEKVLDLLKRDIGIHSFGLRKQFLWNLRQLPGTRELHPAFSFSSSSSRSSDVSGTGEKRESDVGGHDTCSPLRFGECMFCAYQGWPGIVDALIRTALCVTALHDELFANMDVGVLGGRIMVISMIGVVCIPFQIGSYLAALALGVGHFSGLLAMGGLYLVDLFLYIIASSICFGIYDGIVN
jgi:hypothetical protein